MKYIHGEVVKCLPLLAPVDLGGSTNASSYIDLDQAASAVTFEVSLGAMTATDTTEGVTIILEASTAGAGTDTQTALAFHYQVSSAVNTDAMGAESTSGSTGILVDTTEDNAVALLYVETPAVANAVTDGRYVRVGLDPGSSVSASIVGVNAWYIPRYAASTSPSST